MTIAVVVYLGVVAVLAAAGAGGLPVERVARIGLLVGQVGVGLLVAADLISLGRGHRPDELVTHLGYAAAAVGITPLLLGQRFTEEGEERRSPPLLLVALAAVVMGIVVLRLGQTWRLTTGGRLLVAVYAVFAVAAGARSTVQMLTKFDEAPLAYLLSFVAALIYVAATLALRRTSERAFRVAVAACTLELAGVLIVGTLSLARSDLFPDQTVWSDYGQGYGYVPLVLPVIGLGWLARRSRQSDKSTRA